MVLPTADEMNYLRALVPGSFGGRNISQTLESGDLSKLRVKELKEVAKYFRGLPAFGAYSFRLTGLKQDLLDDLKRAISQQPRGNPGGGGGGGAYIYSGYNNPLRQQALQPFNTNMYNQNFGMPQPYSAPAPPPSHDRHAQARRTSESPEFRRDRSPFHTIISTLDAFIANYRKTTSLTFTLDTSINRTHRMHLRLYNIVDAAHEEFPRGTRITVNGNWVAVPEARKLSRTKKKGYQVMRPLDISERCRAAGLSNDVKITLDSEIDTLHPRYLIAVEFVATQDVHQVLGAIPSKSFAPSSGSAEAAPAFVTPPVIQNPQCASCGTTQEVQRCSQCKQQWYCGHECQLKHWGVHQEVRPRVLLALPFPSLKLTTLHSCSSWLAFAYALPLVPLGVQAIQGTARCGGSKGGAVFEAPTAR